MRPALQAAIGASNRGPGVARHLGWLRAERAGVRAAGGRRATASQRRRHRSWSRALRVPSREEAISREARPFHGHRHAVSGDEARANCRRSRESRGNGMMDLALQRACRSSRTLPLRRTGPADTAGQTRPQQAIPASEARTRADSRGQACRNFAMSAAAFGGISGDGDHGHRGTRNLVSLIAQPRRGRLRTVAGYFGPEQRWRDRIDSACLRRRRRPSAVQAAVVTGGEAERIVTSASNVSMVGFRGIQCRK